MTINIKLKNMKKNIYTQYIYIYIYIHINYKILYKILAGPSGQAISARSMFEGPQGMSFAGAVNVSVTSMFP